MIISEFIVDALTSYQSTRQNAAMVHMKSNSELRGMVFLPPYMGTEQTGIAPGSNIICIFDAVSGYGVACIGLGSAEFNGKLNYNISTTGEITATGDIRTGNISLRSHLHAFEGVVAGAACSGVTNSPTGV